MFFEVFMAEADKKGAVLLGKPLVFDLRFQGREMAEPCSVR
ncbi:hypothetical protein X474_10305 [Dethiosulfatarculus sandiegensis]|uniref:Uncharacterized protein n=1 Tax=Dethiosulfatarculus sandiegensis TaxID=1429043 RepID=A0A0D2GI00_9BACT|nr:hypothetical protein X474_10305 [Dethiosulfatarculus sandiegensis]